MSSETLHEVQVSDSSFQQTIDAHLSYQQILSQEANINMALLHIEKTKKKEFSSIIKIKTHLLSIGNELPQLCKPVLDHLSIFWPWSGPRFGLLFLGFHHFLLPHW